MLAKEKRTPRSTAPALLGAALLVVAIAGIIAYFLLRDIPAPPAGGGKGRAPGRTDASGSGTGGKEPARPVVTEEDDLDSGRDAPGDEPAPPARLEIPSGRVVITTPWLENAGEYPAAVLEGAWLALPLRACLGVTALRVRLTQGGGDHVVAGTMWTEGEEIVYWQLDEPLASPPVPLAPWNPELELTWNSFSGERLDHVPVETREEIRGYVRVEVAEPITGRWGIFQQEGKVVGWSFGAQLPGGWLLTSRRPVALEFEMTPEQFYRRVFGGGREERFADVLARRGELPEASQFAMLCDGFRLPARLPEADTPEVLRSETVARAMLVLLASLESQGLSAEALRRCDAGVLAEALSRELFIAVLEATHRESGAEAALGLLQQVWALARDAVLLPAADFEKRERALYVEWIAALVHADQLALAARAWNEARRRLPEDGEIHLLGVEIAVGQGDWQEGERLLAERRYVGELRDRARELEKEIAKLKLPDGKYVIRFPPGSRSVRSSALLDGRVQQEFVIDTGATITTIPLAAAEALRIRIDGTLPRRKVNTAGGEVTAPEVQLASLDLQGAVVTELSVLVLDLPGEPGVGLIGINFLRNFNVDLRTDDGLLFLEPK